MRQLWRRTGMRPKSRRAATLFCLAVAVLTGCGAAESSDTAVCAATLDFAGRSYTGYGEVTAIPPDSQPLGEGVFPPCDDGFGGGSAETVQVRRLAGFDPKEAVVVGREEIFLADDLEPVPARIRVYFDAVRCSTDGPFTVAGQWIGVSAHAKGNLEPPYDMTVLVRSGDDGGEQYRRSYIDIRVTRDTRPEPDRADVKIALWGPGTVTGRVNCEDGRFVADAVEASGQPR